MQPLNFACETSKRSILASELEREMVVCFFDYQEIKDLPIKIMNHVTSRLVVGQVTQLLYAKPERDNSV